MKKVLMSASLLIAMLALSFQANAQGGGYGAKTKDVVDIAAGSQAHTTLVTAVKAAELVSTLKGDGPFTIFAPTNEAFEALPEGTLTTLLKPENKDMLTNILTYHVVSGNLDSKAVVNAIQGAEGGVAELAALNGGTIKAMVEGENVYLMDEKGNKAKVTAVDLKGSNGVIHVIDSVIMPE